MDPKTETLAHAAQLAYKARQAARQAARLAAIVRNGLDSARDEREAARMARFARLQSNRAERTARLTFGLEAAI